MSFKILQCWIFLLLLLMSELILNQPVYAQRVVVNPNDDTLCLLYYHIAHQTPPIDKFAQNEPSVIKADEFTKAKVQADAEKTISDTYKSLADVKFVKLNINMSLGTYDTTLGEFDLSGFAADKYLSYRCFGNTSLYLQFNNSSYAQSWAMKPADAEHILSRNGGSRNIVAISKIALTGVNPSTPDTPLILVGDVKEVKVVGQYNSTPLGQYMVPAK